VVQGFISIFGGLLIYKAVKRKVPRITAQKENLKGGKTLSAKNSNCSTSAKINDVCECGD
jgi:hypothetical protein